MGEGLPAWENSLIRQASGNVPGMLETISGLLLLVLRFREVFCSLSEVGQFRLVRENAFGLFMTPTPIPRGNGAFSNLGAGTVCLGTILHSLISPEIPGSRSSQGLVPWTCSLDAFYQLVFLVKDGGRNMKGDKTPTWFCCLLESVVFCGWTPGA